MTDEEITRRIKSFPRWAYAFDIQGHTTPVVFPDGINRHAQRKAYFFDPVVALYGGTLAGKRVLDLGCNAGYWSLHAIEAGADAIVGVDVRQMHIEQANFVFEAKEIPKGKYRFVCGNIYDVFRTDLGQFDIVLCLGLLYHVGKHLELLELIAAANTDLLVIDTGLSPRQGVLLEVKQEDTIDPRRGVGPLVMVPTRDALLLMTRSFGYQTEVLAPHFTDYTAGESYRVGLRRAFLCSKHTDLMRLRDRFPDVFEASAPTVSALAQVVMRLKQLRYR